jgi:hypothetical protein
LPSRRKQRENDRDHVAEKLQRRLPKFNQFSQNGVFGRDNVAVWTNAAVYAGLGEKDEAFQWLERVYEERSTVNIKADPIFDRLRSDPRFAELLRRMNLQP